MEVIPNIAGRSLAVAAARLRLLPRRRVLVDVPLDKFASPVKLEAARPSLPFITCGSDRPQLGSRWSQDRAPGRIVQAAGRAA